MENFLIFGSYSFFVLPAFVLSYFFYFYLFLKTKKEMEIQEKILEAEFKYFSNKKVEVFNYKKISKVAIESGQIH